MTLFQSVGELGELSSGKLTCRWLEDSHFSVGNTVDGSEIRRSPVEVGSLSHYLYGFIHLRWLFGISEPSTVGNTSTDHFGSETSQVSHRITGGLP